MGLTLPMAPGKWPVRDLVAHLIYWNQMGLDFVRDKLAGGDPVWPGYDFDRQNRAAAQQWSGHSSEQMLEELDIIRRDTVQLVEEIGSEGLKEKWYYDGGSTQVGEFINSLAGHQLYYCKQIQEWRAENSI